MPTAERTDRVVVTSDRGFWWAPVLRWAAIGAAWGVVVAVALAFDQPAWSWLAIPMLAITIGVPLGLVHSVVWLLGPVRVRYELTERELVAHRGKRVVRSFERSVIGSVTVSEGCGLTWTHVLFSNWFGYLGPVPGSSVEVLPKTRWDAAAGTHPLPTLLVWGEENRAAANRALNPTDGHHDA